MADQDKDRTNTNADQDLRTGGSTSDLRSSTQQRTGAVDASVDLVSTSGTSGTGSTIGTGMSGSSATGGTDTQEQSDTLQEAKEAGKRLAGEAKQATRDMAETAKEKGRSLFDKQKESAATQVNSAASAFRSTARHLEEEGQSQTGHYVSMVADKLESFGGQLRGKNLDALVRDAEDIGRRSPGVFFAGSVIAGFLLSRFLKSSAEHRHQSSMSSDDDWTSDYPPSRSPYSAGGPGAIGGFDGDFDSTSSASYLDENDTSRPASGLSGDLTGGTTGVDTGTTGTSAASSPLNNKDNPALPSNPSTNNPGGTTYGNR